MQIAAKLNISEQTIKNHITSILDKLDATTAPTLWCWRCGKGG
jgi:DNA-binding NarL/FixJ family response regulator